ncbi:MAG: indole-3-glycerol phosphate synthase TrpC [Nitrospinota bacterium]
MRLSPIIRSIVEQKRAEVESLTPRLPVKLLRQIVQENRVTQKVDQRSQFESALISKTPKFKIIAEIKRATPLKMLRSTNFAPASIAIGYEQAGAVAISVVTESRFFCGSPIFLPIIRRLVKIPLLRKDFIITKWQLYETAILGADAILIIPALFESKSEFEEIYHLANELNIEPLIEVGDETDLEYALKLDPKIIGINNRNFKSDTLEINIKNSIRLRNSIPKDKIVISESAITGLEDILALADANIERFLIGSLFMKESDPQLALKNLVDQLKEVKHL